MFNLLERDKTRKIGKQYFHRKLLQNAIITKPVLTTSPSPAPKIPTGGCKEFFYKAENAIPHLG